MVSPSSFPKASPSGAGDRADQVPARPPGHQWDVPAGARREPRGLVTECVYEPDVDRQVAALLALLGVTVSAGTPVDPSPTAGHPPAEGGGATCVA
jgi:hypothetical protein